MGGGTPALEGSVRSVIRRFVVRPIALEEITEAAEWYERRSGTLSAEFLRAVDAVVAAIERAPERFPKIHREKRHALLRRFPYSIVFTASAEEIIVLSCTHWRQNTDRWRGRD